VNLKVLRMYTHHSSVEVQNDFHGIAAISKAIQARRLSLVFSEAGAAGLDNK